jgi:hypothetical protein
MFRALQNYEFEFGCIHTNLRVPDAKFGVLGVSRKILPMDDMATITSEEMQ